MAVPEEFVKTMQAQMVAWQAEQTANWEKMKADLQAAFNVKMAEVTGAGVDRRDPRDDRNLFDAKHFRLCKVFDGSSAGVKWEEWQFDFLRAVSSRSAECGDELDDLLKEAGTTKDVTNIAVDQNLSKYGPQLFNVLCGLTTGEANLIVRSTSDKGMGYCGFIALCLLSRRYNPKTPARVLQYLTAVLSPPVVKDVRLLESAIEEWEAKKYRLKSEFKEELSDNVSIAILTSMLSRDLQDMVYQQGKLGETLTYKEVRDKVMSVAGHRAHQAVPAPMDVGQVGEGGEQGDGEWLSEDCYEVDAVTKGNCYACGGWGHVARDCPTRASKGKGKSKGDAAKGGGKFGGKGVPNKGIGKGFGYQGTCYNCGVVGHKAAECTGKPQQQQHVREVAQELPPAAIQTNAAAKECNSVWCINAVTRAGEPLSKPQDATEEWRIVRGRWRKTGSFREPWMPLTCNANPVKVSPGRFGVLGVHDVVEKASDGGEVWICPVVNKEEVEDSEHMSAVCGVTEITVDSAADESVCPLKCAEQFGMQPIEPGKELRLVNASGGKIAHWGSRRVRVQAAGVERPLDIGFQVTDVTGRCCPCGVCASRATSCSLARTPAAAT